MARSRRAGVIGLGAAGGFVLEALRALGTVRCVGGVDPRPGAAAKLVDGPVFSDISGLHVCQPLDLVAVCTPTAMHAATLQGALALEAARVWVDKPRVTDLSDYDALQPDGVQVRTMFHRAFASEVLHAAGALGGWRERHGAVVAVDCAFADANAGDQTRVRSIGDCWLDSGINALSVLARLDLLPDALADARGALPDQADVAFDGGDGPRVTIACRWTRSSAAKDTRLSFADGTTVAIDHLAATVTDEDGVHHFERQSLPGRYETMLREYLADGPLVLDAATDRHLHALLLGAHTALR